MIKHIAICFWVACEVVHLSAAGSAPPIDPPKLAGRSEAAIIHVQAKEGAALLRERPEVVVLDIRTPNEFKAGHIANAKNIDFHGSDFARELGKLDKRKTYLVHCASGRRSTKSLELFRKLDFQSVYHLDGGVRGWQAAGLPLVQSSLD